jgi:hypothetical protein
MVHSRAQESIPNTLKRASATQRKISLTPGEELFLIKFNPIQIQYIASTPGEM